MTAYFEDLLTSNQMFCATTKKIYVTCKKMYVQN